MQGLRFCVLCLLSITRILKLIIFCFDHSNVVVGDSRVLIYAFTNYIILIQKAVTAFMHCVARILVQVTIS